MLLGILLILVTLTGCGLFVARPTWFPLPVSPEAFAFDRQFSRTLWVAGIIFISTQLLLAWMLIRRGRNRKPAHPSLEVGAVAATAMLFLFLAAAGSRGWASSAIHAPGEETIEVYAHQFAWSFRYPGADGRFGRTANRYISDSGANSIGLDPSDPAGRDDIVTASLRIPAGTNVLLLLHSRDVIHDFFVRELRTKQDIVPGMEISLEIRADIPGRYEIACAELCGAGHSQMRAFLIVMKPGDYFAWKKNPASAM